MRANPTTRFPLPRSSIRNESFCALTLALAACSTQPTEFAWSHSASGEYLFAFDVRECGDHARNELARVHAPAETALQSPAFFDCMSGRGYFLVDPSTGLALTRRDVVRASGSPQAQR
jgi:hypothetical protein